jgi:hypothetical protein
MVCDPATSGKFQLLRQTFSQPPEPVKPFGVGKKKARSKERAFFKTQRSLSADKAKK